MTQITGLKSAPFQTFNVPAPTTEKQAIRFSLSYRPRVRSWFLDLVYGTFEVDGLRMARGVNMLRNYRLPFGLAVYVSDDLDPMFVDDFATGRAVMYLLSEDDMKSIEEGTA